jgi:hypothetical protein
LIKSDCGDAPGSRFEDFVGIVDGDASDCEYRNLYGRRNPAQGFKADRLFAGSSEDGSKDYEIASGRFRCNGFFHGVDGHTQRFHQRTHTIGGESVGWQVNTIDIRSERDVETIIHEDPSARSLGDVT